MEFTDDKYYSYLQIDKDAEPDVVKWAYRKLANKYHPDNNPGEEARFQKISEAYTVISDPDKRKEYDEFLERISAEKTAGMQAQQQSGYGEVKTAGSLYVDTQAIFQKAEEEYQSWINEKARKAAGAKRKKIVLSCLALVLLLALVISYFIFKDDVAAWIASVVDQVKNIRWTRGISGLSGSSM